MKKNEMMNIQLHEQEENACSWRSDLAIEAHQMALKNLNFGKEGDQVDEEQQIPGVLIEEKDFDKIKCVKVEVVNEEGEKATGKPVGTYYTYEAQDLLCLLEDKEIAVLTEEIKKTFQSLISEDMQNIFVVGLGNWKVTPDALGPKVVEGLNVSRHIKGFLTHEQNQGIRDVSALMPGVLGITGIETMEIVKGVTDGLRPDCIVAVDALASGSVGRIGTTLQIADTGISPGAGVKNKRMELSKKTLGVPVIAVGMPTVIDASALVEGISSSFMVTPKEIDAIIDDTSKVISKAINVAFGLDAIYN